ncbi:MAG TPA: sugar transferase [Thermoguttaceae bacterium]|nr:sugar transferase [Thermoguttaceae bacterium]
MLIAKTIGSLRKLTGHREESVSQHLHSAEQMHVILEHERARADRSNDEFSMIVFKADGGRTSRAVLRHCGESLTQRLRFTDQVGRLSDRQVAAVLCGTPASESQRLIDDVISSLGPDQPVPECEVYSYPSNWSYDQDIEEQETPDSSTDDRRLSAMEPLFARPLPTWKRCMDVVAASLGLLLLLPLFLVVAVATRLSSSGPALFKQCRSGLAGKPFMMYKFRTMVVDAEAKKQELMAANEQDGPAFKIKNDPRITRLGAFLRKTSIDELPQLWNVLKGDMTLVGPRPLPCSETAGCTGWHRRRLDVTPGLTCIWQVEGRSKVTFAEWVRMDIQYIRSRSVMRDLGLLIRTVGVVLLRRGAC